MRGQVNFVVSMEQVNCHSFFSCFMSSFHIAFDEYSWMVNGYDVFSSDPSYSMLLDQVFHRLRKL